VSFLPNALGQRETDSVPSPIVKHVLLVDDEPHIRDVVTYALEKSGYRVTTLGEGRRAAQLVDSAGIDLVILDIMLPGTDGLEICRQIRSKSLVPILFLSARSDEVDRVIGLEVGGDDYLTKPFSPRELVARVKAILRRFDRSEQMSLASKLLSCGALTLDPERYEARYAGQTVALTATEFALLATLIERPGIVLSRAQLIERTYDDVHISERTLDTHVRRIRAKFRPLGSDPITTVHGVGYKATEVK
jgi:two-component system, OmpR family, response regulator